MVFFHELGHFFLARWNGVFVETFSMGMGKELFSWQDKLGTKWRIALLPLGGYCKMRGENDGLTNDKNNKDDQSKLDTNSAEYLNTCYEKKGVYARIAIAAAGPIANFLLALVIFWGIFFTFGIRQIIPEVGEVMQGGAAIEAGFKKGDSILAINNKKTIFPGDVQRMVSLSIGKKLLVDIERDGKLLQLFTVPRLGEVSDGLGGTQKTGALGIGLIEREVGRIKLGVFDSMVESASRVGMVINVTFTYLGQIITGKQDSSNLSGPIRIVQISSQLANQQGIVALLGLAAILSISLGIINLFPIPVLDGGHILFYIIEAVKGSPLSEKIQEHAMRVGIVMIFALMVFVTLNDVVHLGLFSAG